MIDLEIVVFDPDYLKNSKKQKSEITTKLLEYITNTNKEYCQNASFSQAPTDFTEEYFTTVIDLFNTKYLSETLKFSDFVFIKVISNGKFFHYVY